MGLLSTEIFPKYSVLFQAFMVFFLEEGNGLLVFSKDRIHFLKLPFN